MLKLENIHKHFGGIKALDGVDLTVKKGNIHGLVGENGAGKSTLIKILTGVYKNDSGGIILNNQKIDIRNPIDAKNKGIVAIYQELSLIEELSVSHNIFLGHEPISNKILGITNKKELYKKTKNYLKRFELDIDPKTDVGELGLGQKRILEILKAITTLDTKLLLLDEPTSGMSKAEIERFFVIVDRFKKEELTMLYISHHLENIYRLSDVVTVLRNGKKINTHDINCVNEDELVHEMIGKEMNKKAINHKIDVGDKVKFKVQNIKTRKMVEPLSFELFEGEILGITGIVGAGKSELGRALISYDPKESGEMEIDGENIEINSPIDAKNNGIVLVPEDRKTQGLFLELDIKENLTLPNVDKISNKYSFLLMDLKRKLSLEVAKKVNVIPLDIDIEVENLSGGNQQKVVFGKWLMSDPKIMILDEPTKGVDVGAKKEIYQLIRNLTDQGVSIIILSSEFKEIKNISDRIIILRKSEIVKNVKTESITEEKILSTALGGSK